MNSKKNPAAFQVHLDAEQAAIAERLGNGDIGVGIRHALTLSAEAEPVAPEPCDCGVCEECLQRIEDAANDALKNDSIVRIIQDEEKALTRKFDGITAPDA